MARASAPPSKTGKPSSTRAASKPASTRALKPLSVKAVPAKTASRRGAASIKSTNSTDNVPPPIGEDGDVVMGGGATSQPNGTPAKKGRAADLVKEARKPARRSSVGRGIPLKLALPQIPPPAKPHNALFIFGSGEMGQFGLGPDVMEEIKRPKLHDWFEGQITTGALSRNGQPGAGGLEAVAAGGMHTLAIDEAGRVLTWGINDNACLGRITADVPDPDNPGEKIPTDQLETVPTEVEGLSKSGFRAVAIAAGDSASVAISEKGELRAWGSFRGNDGLLGFGGSGSDSRFQFKPIALPAFERARVQIAAVSCGTDHVLALTTAGHVYVWGNGQQNQLGRRIIERRKLNSLEPERLGLRNIVYIAAGAYHSFAVDKNGTVWSWGLNTFHQTGISSNRGGDEDMIMIPTQVDALAPEENGGAKVVQISGGEHHSLFLSDNGQVWAVGRADGYQVGIPRDHPAYEGIKEREEEIKASKRAKWEAKKADYEKHLQNGGLDEDTKSRIGNEVEAAQIDINTKQDSFVPEPVRLAFPPIPEQYEVVPEFPAWKDSDPDENPIAHISAGTRHNLAVSRSGHVYSWGVGISSQLGLGNQDEAEVPSLVRSKWLRPYRAISASAGGQHCCLLAQLKEEEE